MLSIEWRKGIVAGACLAALAALSACGGSQKTVVVYTALDRNFSEPIFRQFTEETGIKVLPKYDTESTKTVGLVNAIIAEAGRPRCDVFWNNEIVNTVRLKKKGLLQPCSPDHAELYPDTFKDPDGEWYGFAARARVIIVNTNNVSTEDIPRSVDDLAGPRFKGRAGIAKPLFGTTASHVACLFTLLGPETARDKLLHLKGNEISVESGNKSCALKVAQGHLDAALTDTDDAIIEKRRGAPVVIVFPDSDAGGVGTLFIPNTLALIAECPHPEEGVRLISYLLSPEVEKALSSGESAQIPLNTRYDDQHELGALPDRWMKVSFEDAADQFESAGEWIKREFLSP
ncbi:MAG: extracellular solute-binding protein [Verrucomicrobia bacterium]|nr:extracellular solute-binding protein [Verrucomicrobiota bacterium]